MDSKLSILFLFTIVGQSSLALDTSVSCSSPVTEIGVQLATIQYGEDTAQLGLGKVADGLRDVMITLLPVRYGKRSTYSEELPSTIELARNESFTSLMVGLIPTLEAIQQFQPDLNISALMPNVTITVHAFNDNIILGLEAALKSQNSAESQAEIATFENNVLAGGSTLIEGFFRGLLNGAKPIPDEAESVIACVQAKSASEISSAVKAIFKQIRILSEAMSDPHAVGAYEKYSSRITAAHQEARESFSAEIIYKYTAIRNLVMAEYLNKTGTVTGLFDIQSTPLGKKFV